MAMAKSRRKMTFGEAAAVHLRNLDDNLSIKPRTRDYWRECLVALQKSWLGLNETEAREIFGVCPRLNAVTGDKNTGYG
jgi:hypothetical protein